MNFYHKRARREGLPRRSIRGRRRAPRTELGLGVARHAAIAEVGDQDRLPPGAGDRRGMGVGGDIAGEGGQLYPVAVLEREDVRRRHRGIGVERAIERVADDAPLVTLMVWLPAPVLGSLVTDSTTFTVAGLPEMFPVCREHRAQRVMPGATGGVRGADSGDRLPPSLRRDRREHVAKAALRSSAVTMGAAFTEVKRDGDEPLAKPAPNREGAVTGHRYSAAATSGRMRRRREPSARLQKDLP